MILLISSCSNNKIVFWCGDHPCVNKKEKEAYFKKTMIVETKEIKKEFFKKNSNFENLLKQAQVSEKNRVKEEKRLRKIAKLEEKIKIKEEKRLKKIAKLEEKKLIEELENEEKKLMKNEKKKTSKKITKNKKKILIKSDAEINLNKFNKLVEKITKRNSLKPYPNINNMPN